MSRLTEKETKQAFKEIGEFGKVSKPNSMNIETLKKIAEWAYPEKEWAVNRERVSQVVEGMRGHFDSILYDFNIHKNEDQRLHLQDKYREWIEPQLETAANERNWTRYMMKYWGATESAEALLEAIARNCLND